MTRLGPEKAAQAQALLDHGEVWLFCTTEGSDPAVQLVFDTAVTGMAAFLIHPDRGALALVANYDRGHVELLGIFDEIRDYRLSFHEALADWLVELRPDRVLLNWSETDHLCDGLTHGQFLGLERTIRGALPGVDIASSERQLIEVRSVKTAEEVRRLRGAIDGTIDVYADVREFIAVGRTEREIQGFMNDAAKERGLAPYAGGHGGPLVCINRVGLAHRSPTETAVEPGDLVIIDTGLQYEGFYSDIARTFYVRRPGEDTAPDELQEVFGAIHSAISHAFEALRPGVLGCEVDRVARATLREHGQPDIIHATGHQIGRNVHDGGAILGPEWDRYGDGPQQPVKAGHVFTLEPTVVRSPEPSMIVEEDVLVTADGATWLHPRQDELWLV